MKPAALIVILSTGVIGWFGDGGTAPATVGGFAAPPVVVTVLPRAPD